MPGPTRDTGFLRNLISYDASGNIVLPANLTVTGSLLTSGGATYATQSYVTTQISNLVNAAPGALDTLNELAAALGNDANFSTTVTNSIATKLALSGGTLTGALSGTSATFSANTSGGFAGLTLANAGTGAAQIYLNNSAQSWIVNLRTDNHFSVFNATSSTTPFLINTTGAATFSSSVTAGAFTPSYSTSYFGTDGTISNYSAANYMYVNGTGGLRLKAEGVGYQKIVLEGGTSNDVWFTTANTERMRITSAGNVGIGTTAPAYNLSVASYLGVGAQGGGDIVLIGGGSGVGAFIQLRYATGTINNEFRGNGNNYVNNLLGNFGIGTNDPTHRLDVVGGSGTTPVASFTSGGNSWSEGIYINPSTANGYAGIYYPIAADSQADGMWFTGRITSTDSNFPNGFGFARKGLTGGGIPGWGGNAMNIKQDGTVYFGFDVRHGQNYKGLTFVQLTSCIGWSTSVTNNTQTTISTTGLGLPSGVKAISVVGWYHIRNYGAAAGQGDHAMAWFGISNDQTPLPWSDTNGGYPYSSNTFTRADYGSFVMEHDGDSSIATGSSGGPHYYGSWHNGIINVNANGTIYCNLASGYSGGTHYFALYIQGYWI